MTDSIWQDPLAAITDIGGTLALRLAATVIVLGLSWILIRLGTRAFERSAKRVALHRKFDEYQTKAAISQTKPMTMGLRLLVIILAGIALLGIWGLTGAFAGLLAGAGFAGIVIGLAAGDIIADILAGFILLYRGPFHVGDWVEIDGVQGIIHDVNLADTIVHTFDNEVVSFPNSLVETNKIINFTIGRQLRLRIPVGVEYGSDLQKAKEILLAIGNDHPKVKELPAPSAWVRNFLDSAVELDLRVWIDPVLSSALEVRSDMVQQIHDRFRAEGIVIAFPHMQVVQSHPWKVTKDLE